MKRIFEKDNTIQFTCKFYDIDGTLTDVDVGSNAKITVTDSDGNVEVNNQNMAKQSTGVYHYYWAPSEADTYIVKMSGTVDVKTQLTRKEFKVVETTIE